MSPANRSRARHILVTRWRPPVISGDTNAEGRFRLVFPQGSVHYQTLIASADGGKRQGLVEVAHTANDLVTNVRIILKPARAITVRVVNELQDPVIGASVGLFEQLTPFVIGDTDRQGSIDFQYPVDMKLTQIAALKPGVGFDYFENYRSARGSIPLPPPKQVTLTLNGARKVKVRAEDSAGRPLANIEFIPLQIQKKGRLFYCNLSGAVGLRGALRQERRERHRHVRLVAVRHGWRYDLALQIRTIPRAQFRLLRPG